MSSPESSKASNEILSSSNELSSCSEEDVNETEERESSSSNKSEQKIDLKDVIDNSVKKGLKRKITETELCEANSNIESEKKDSQQPIKSETENKNADDHLKKTNIVSSIPAGYVFGAKMKIPKPSVASVPPKPIEFEPLNVDKLAGFEGSKSPLFEQIGSVAKLETVEVTHGEEDDTIILDIGANLFVFDSENKNWKGLGAVNVHLNDCVKGEDCYSRIIIRRSDTHRLIINSRLSSFGSFEKKDHNQMIMAVCDPDNKPKVYCLKASCVDELFKQITQRLKN
ncbi:Ran-binding protein 3-like protein [Thelohanellus kitauei]|uniref:Ran-binding protein 3-like protein n=1 Tax=Thelohanellus kitauei TaxID=669202 RepID=A0A0C2N311_THEKT|nr:Ran-binding protein 3-like protein [Thelohanellus kitauei]